MGRVEQVIGPRWRQLATGSANRRILGAALVVGGATAVVSLAAIARELLLAATFGTSDALDAFLIAVLLPTFIVNVIAGSFASALVPTFIQVRETEGRAAAQRLFSEVMTLGLGLLIVAAAVLALLLPLLLPLLASGFAPEKLMLTRRLFIIILLPSVIFGGMAMMWSSVLNAGERFALAAFAPAVVPLAAVGALLVAPGWGISAVAFGTICGFALQLCIQGWGLRRQGVSLRPRWRGVNPAIRQVIAQYVPMVAAGALMSSTLLVDQAVAATLEPGSVATFSYGTKVVTLVLGLGAGALGTAVLPYFSKMVAVADWVQVRQTIGTYRKLTLLIAIPLTLVLYVFSEPIVALAFQRGAFTAADTMLVTRVQSLYALQIPFYLLVILYVRLLSSLAANHLVVWLAVISFPLNAALDYFLARMFGVAGIALATSLMYVAAVGFLAIALRRILANATLQGQENRGGTMSSHP